MNLIGFICKGLPNQTVQRMSAAGVGEDSGVLGALIADLSRWAGSPMTPFRTFTLLVAACLLSGCQDQPRLSLASAQRRDTAVGDARRFAEILDYYRKTFPNVSFSDGRAIHVSDGPEGERLHINVPVAMDAEYQHSYAPAFLMEQSQSTNGLARMVAGDLLLLRKERLFSYRGGRFGFGGVMVDCITYVIKDDRAR